MLIRSVEVFDLKMRLRHPFETSFGREDERRFLLVRVETEDHVGWGEVTVSEDPFYSYETTETAAHVLRRHLIPAILGHRLDEPRDALAAMTRVRGHQMAKAGLEGALWDIRAQELSLPLYRALGGDRTSIDVGISVGIEPTIDELVAQVEGFLAQGYRRIKVKIRPGWDRTPLSALRSRFGDIAMMADANSAYSLADLHLLKSLDEFGLMMIEQPLHYDDIIDHAKLQSEIHTPICLDESIHSAQDAKKAFEIGAARIINIKIGRLGGLSESLATHDIARAGGHPVWCGGMLESGVGRLHNVAITTLPGFTLPGDTAASQRYWVEDIIEPEVVVTQDGRIEVPQAPGLGHRVREQRIRNIATSAERFTP